MLDIDWLLLEWVGGSKIGEKTLRVMLSCRHKLIKPPHKLQTTRLQDEVNVWKELNSWCSIMVYRKQGKIRWAKCSRIPPNEVFHRKTFVVPYIYNA